MKILKKRDIEKIYLLGIAKLNDFEYKILFIRNFSLINENYKGYFIDSLKLKNNFIFYEFTKKDFNKWYRVEVDLFGNILHLCYKKRKISL